MDTTIEAPAAPPLRRGLNASGAVATVIGNAMEFYDFMSYAYFATYIGQAFFPAETEAGKLLLSLATFGVGFLTRPIGAVVIGAYADRVGRRAAMTLTIALMAMGSAMIALIPPYASIGLAAPALVVLARLIQGFSVGGEVGPATSYLLEAAPMRRRGWYASWQSASQSVASLGAGLLGFTVARLLSPAALESWGWRIPFAVGVLVLPVGIYIRQRLAETLDVASAHRTARAILGHSFTHQWRNMVLGFLAIMGGTVATYVSSYMTTYALTTLHMKAATSMSATVVLGVIGTASAAFGGLLSDRYGRKLLMIAPRVLLAVVALPAFAFLDRERTGWALMGTTALLSMLNSISTGVMLVQISECFPRRVRSTALSITYATAVTVFGGTTQLLIAWLIQATGDPTAPAYYLIGTNLIAAVATAFMRGENADP